MTFPRLLLALDSRGRLAWLDWAAQTDYWKRLLAWLFYLILCLLSLWTRQKHWNEGMLASLGNSWHFVETHKHPPEDPLYCKEAKQRIRTNKSVAHQPLSPSTYRLPLGHDLLLAHCLKVQICNWVFANILIWLKLVSANPDLLCTRIHKHRHLGCLGNFKCFNGCFVIMSGETERFIQR